jgi:hypothetical protein
MRGLGEQTVAAYAVQCVQPKAQQILDSEGKSSLPKKSGLSHSGEFAAVRSVQTDLSSTGDIAGMSDNDPAVTRTVKKLSVPGSDILRIRQEKEARTAGGILSQ